MIIELCYRRARILTMAAIGKLNNVEAVIASPRAMPEQMRIYI
jgi:hypothetical protein